MEYVFFDTVWYQRGSRFSLTATQLLELNARIVTDCFTSEHRYQRPIHPDGLEQIPEQKLVFLNQNRSRLEHADDVNLALQDMIARFPKTAVLVVWKRQTYEVLVYHCKQNNIRIPKVRILILSELIATIDPYASNMEFHFEQALRRYHVKYMRKELHLSENRVYLLKKLYCSAKFYYRQICELELDAQPVLSTITNKIYDRNCPYVNGKNVKSENIKSGVNGLWDGIPVCQHCLKQRALQRMKEEIPFIKIEKTENVEQYVKTLCMRLNLKCEFANSVVFVSSSCARWRIYHNNGKIEQVTHENYRYQISDGFKSKHKFRDGYHKQNLSEGTFYEVLMYIARHDRKFLKSQVTYEGVPSCH